MNMQVREGEIVGIYGENGSGKSTLLNILCGELSIHDGVYTKHASLSMHYLKQSNMDVAQSSIVTVRELLLMHKMKHHCFKGRKEHLAIIHQILVDYGLASVEKKQLCVLSGGELQRVMIVKLLLEMPDVLLLDEPLNALDEHSQALVMDMVKALKEHAISVILVLHNKKLLHSICDRILLCEDHTLKEERYHV